MSLSSFKNVKIAGISVVTPQNHINIDDEIEFFNNDAKLLERNKKILGLGKRHIVDERTNNSDLCEAAAVNLINNLKIDKERIDCIIVASTSHDYRYPASACILQGRLDLSEECLCFDMAGLGCSAYVHALLNAHSLIESGTVKNCLLLVSDLKSKHSDRRNRNSNMLFGDAAIATFLEYSEIELYSYFNVGTRGKGWNKLIAPAGGYDIPIEQDIAGLEIVDKTGNVWRMWDDIMKGLDIFKFATEVGSQGVRDILSYANKRQEDIDFFAFHQANKQIVRTISMYLGLSKDKYSSTTFSEYANCGAASIGTDICHSLSNKNVKNICLSSFGVGLSWGIALLDFSLTKVLPISFYHTSDDKMTRQEKIDYWVSYFKEGNNA